MSALQTMRTILAIALCWFGLGSLTRAEPPFKISIVPERRDADFSFISHAKDTKRSFYVVLTNVSKQHQAVFEVGNSWGYQAISFELTLDANEEKKYKVTVKPQTFTKNVPAIYVIPPQGHQVFVITLDDKWTGMPEFKKPGHTPATIKAIYELKKTNESWEKGVWAGRVESEPVELKISHW